MRRGTIEDAFFVCEKMEWNLTLFTQLLANMPLLLFQFLFSGLLVEAIYTRFICIVKQETTNYRKNLLEKERNVGEASQQ